MSFTLKGEFTLANRNLHIARTNKKDEFYTQLPDIEREVSYYTKHFKNKVVYCNCDDPRVSKFFYYFYINFEKLGLKKLIASCYVNQEIPIFSLEEPEKAVFIEYDGKNKIPFSEIKVSSLNGDGDFRSEDCIELLKQADIVVTNPRFHYSGNMSRN